MIKQEKVLRDSISDIANSIEDRKKFESILNTMIYQRKQIEYLLNKKLYREFMDDKELAEQEVSDDASY